jgi:hypothetical protein
MFIFLGKPGRLEVDHFRPSGGKLGGSGDYGYLRMGARERMAATSFV